MSNTIFKPTTEAIEGTAVPVITNLTMKHFPFQSFLEMTEIIGSTLQQKIIDMMGIIKISGSVPAHGNGAVYFPNSEYVLVLLSKHARCNAIYLGVDRENLVEVGQAVESVLRNTSTVSVECEAAFLGEDGMVQSTTRRSITIQSKDLIANFFFIGNLKEEARAHVESFRKPSQEAAS